MFTSERAKFFNVSKLRIVVLLRRNDANIFFGNTVKDTSKEEIAVKFSLFFLSL